MSTGSPAATVEALRILDEGGSAFDAAITASAVMMAALPAASGPAGDVAAVLHEAGTDRWLSLTGLGRAPAGASRDEFLRRGCASVPETGILSAASPGAIDAWYRLHEAHGTMPMDRLLAPAIGLAADGICVSDQNRRWTADNHPVLGQRAMQELYAPYLEPTALGSLMRQPGLAALLTHVAERAAPEVRALVASAVVDVSRELGGLLQHRDLIQDVSRLEPAVSRGCADRTVYTNPAPTQGPVFLQHLALADLLGTGQDLAHRIHLLAEAVNQSYGWRLRHLGDPAQVVVPDALAPETLDALVRRVDPQRRSPSVCQGAYDEGDTTHFVVADAAGNSVSWVQSLGLGFGSGVGVPELGLLLSNRLGRSCTVRASDVNSVAPGRTPVNTIFAWGVAGPDGRAATGGTPGGDGQTQWNMQTVLGLCSEGADLLDVLSRPKWTYYPGADKAEAGEVGEQIWVDAELDPATVRGLGDRGHDVLARPTVGGVTRVVDIGSNAMLVLDDGRQEGLSAAL
ncbi:gamma-glutamyltransferase [Cellulomonas triticagri]|uniref:Gamma-glutamyltransferase n=1 Tax=Cellulomonas triticagri TaxID=2483352 RepID=A0A3M2J441_9CELL|nr:gamma-glutamyltransferase [Cellulomonas triticagri]